MSTRVQPNHMKCCKGLCIPKNAMPSLPCLSMASLDHTSSRMQMRGSRQSTPSAYLVVIKKFGAALGRHRGVTWDKQWYQQDGATSQTSNDSLTNRFPNRLISRRCAVEWAPDSPDLKPPDFYLWWFLKDNVYKNSLQTIPELTKVTIRGISQQECVRVVDNFARHVQVCLERREATWSTFCRMAITCFRDIVQT